MVNFTSNSYQMKREILSFSNKVSGSCLLTDIVDQLHEKSKKVNSVERLTRPLAGHVELRPFRPFSLQFTKKFPKWTQALFPVPQYCL